MATGEIGRWAGALGLTMLPFLVGCELFTDLDDIEPQCRPDTTRECLCPDGTPGLQRCLNSGQYEECRCGDAGEAPDAEPSSPRDGAGQPEAG